MRTLFFKILVWFWIVTAVVIAVAVAAVWMSPYLHSNPGAPARVLEVVDMQGALAVLDLGGEPAFERHIAELEKASGARIYWINDRGEPLLGKRVPRRLMILADAHRDQTKRGETVVSAPPRADRAIPTTDPKGQSYLGLVEFPPDTPDPIELPATTRSLFNAGTLPLQLAAVLLAAGLGCYLLARYLASPMQALQHVARQLAMGDLTARAGAPLTRRRDEIGELGREFDRMADQVQSLLGSHKRLLHDVSHELRSPLARMNVALELAAQHADGGARVHLDRVGREAKRLNQLIGELLTLARLEGGGTHTPGVRVDLGELLKDVAADAQFEAARLNRRVRLEGPDAGTVFGHEWLLRSALENVVRNAVRYTAPHTEVLIQVRHSTETPTRTIIEVRDHGPGIPEGQLADAFLPFRRIATPEMSPSEEGLGLGLAIAQRAVESELGTIDAANAPGGGLLVTIALPLAAKPRSAAQSS